MNFTHHGMATNMTSIQRLTARKKKTPPEKARPMALIAEATVDAYNESEQRMGFYTMFEEHLDMPFESTILGVGVQFSLLSRYWRCGRG
jgi:hypothetical protein